MKPKKNWTMGDVFTGRAPLGALLSLFAPPPKQPRKVKGHGGVVGARPSPGPRTPKGKHVNTTPPLEKFKQRYRNLRQTQTSGVVVTHRIQARVDSMQALFCDLAKKDQKAAVKYLRAQGMKGQRKVVKQALLSGQPL